MYQPTPADFDVLVSLARDARLDPVDVALVLYEESGFDPASPGPSAAAKVYGLNQMSADNLASLHLVPSEWVRLSAGDQLPHIFAFWRGLGQTFNGGRMPRDAGELLALNFLPGAFKNIDASNHPDAALCGVDGPYAWAWNDNPALHDPSGIISVNTLRGYLGRLRAKLATSAHWSTLVNGIRNALARAGGNGPGGSGEVAVSPSPSPGRRLVATTLPALAWVAIAGLALFALAPSYARRRV